MKTMLVLAVVVTCLAGSAEATEKARCAAKPFSLTKPSAEPAAKPAPAPAKVAATPAKPKADCKKKSA